MIRGDYGIAKFRREEDANRCLTELQGKDFGGSTLRMEAAKPKLPSGKAAKGGSAAAAGDDETADGKDWQHIHLRSVQLRGLPKNATKETISAWVEEQLPGGCGIEGVKRLLGEEGNGSAFIVTFRKDQNARRALEVLNGAKMDGQTAFASLRALELSRQSSKAGRLIVRNLAFGATEKHVRQAFQQLGELGEVNIPPKPGGKPGMHRGFAFVQYADAATAQRAVTELNGTKICGRGVAVDWAVDASVYSSLQSEEKPEEKPQKSEEPRSRKRPAAEMEEDEDQDDNDEEDEEDEEDEARDEDDEEEDDAVAEESPNDELRRMRELMGQDVEEGDDDEDGSEDGSGSKSKSRGKEKTDAKRQKTEKKKSSATDKEKARKPGFDVDQGRTVFVRNVPFDANDADLREVFRGFGKVGSVNLVPDRSGQNPHRGSAFVKFLDASGAEAALATEEEANKKLKELGSVVKRSDKRDLPAVEGFGISLKGRRLVVKSAVNPTEASELTDSSRPQKGAAAKERQAWMHLLNVGDISETSENWNNLSKSEQRQRQAGRKERKWRINNPNFTIHPQRLAIRNLPMHIDATQLRQKMAEHLAEKMGSEGTGKKIRMKEAQDAIIQASLVRDTERKNDKGERRSKGFGFIAFKDHAHAMAGLQYLNDNSRVFGGLRRPIVEFAVDDKRKLRMQEESISKFKVKLGNKKGAGASADAKGKGKGTAGEAELEDGKPKVKKLKKRKPKEKAEDGKAKQLSRGQRQRENRRQKKVESELRAKSKAANQAKYSKIRDIKNSEKDAEKRIAKKKVPLRSVPDAEPPAKKKKTQPIGDIGDDFELRAMERFRRANR
ncbi:unnamed protein product [Polarella glacialis]|uniref:RRM domain-containing protein n=1 Tax=Polarella glacialis TaxID=89957 RepID=A0A813EUU2_POLGL|nr:unnamed protein product [Polarella glacialis]